MVSRNPVLRQFNNSRAEALSERQRQRAKGKGLGAMGDGEKTSTRRSTRSNSNQQRATRNQQQSAHAQAFFASFSASQHLTACPSSRENRGDLLFLQNSNAAGQRGWKRHPGGSRIRFG